MKKSLLALAVLGAFAGAAAAQSSVTMYGKLDLGLVKANDGASILTGGPSNDELQLSQQAGSRLGFRGSEDLGGGLRANFGFEHRFTPDNGAADSTFWQGFSWVGLSGGFGEVRLGRDYSPYFWTNIAADPWGYDTVGQIGMVHTASAVAVVSRYSNLISYRTPNLNGLTAQVAIGLAEATNDTKDNVGFNVEYRGGPLYVGFGFHQGDSAAGITGLASALGTTPAALGIVAGDKGTSMGITASYNFGVARLIGAYSTAKAESTGAGDDYSANNWSLAVSAPLGGGDLRAMYTRLTGKDLLDGTKNTKVGLGYHYPLSKRTKVYADVGSAKTTSLDRRTAFDFGIQHNF